MYLVCDLPIHYRGEKEILNLLEHVVIQEEKSYYYHVLYV